jgi:hypothetical protein
MRLSDQLVRLRDGTRTGNTLGTLRAWASCSVAVLPLAANGNGASSRAAVPLSRVELGTLLNLNASGVATPS